MRIVPVEKLQEGMILAQDLFSEDGTLLLGKGYALRPKHIEKIDLLGLVTVYIDDEASSGIEVEPVISAQTFRAFSKTLKTNFDGFSPHLKDFQQVAASQIHQNLRRPVFRNALSFNQTREVISQVLDDLSQKELVLENLDSLHTHSNYQFQHALDVTVLALTLGRKIGLPRTELESLGIGALFHDIGMLLIPAEILEKKGRLTMEEFLFIKEHPSFGYKILQQNPDFGYVIPHVAYQHHEKQDGTGYPRKLQGKNEIALTRSFKEKYMIHRYAEITAIADCYSAMTKVRCYRKPLPPEKALENIRNAAGHHLNQEMVGKLLEIIPPFPVGTNVEIIQGKHIHFKGIVAKLYPQKLERPILKILFDEHDKNVSPFALDLLKEPDTQIQSIESLPQ